MANLTLMLTGFSLHERYRSLRISARWEGHLADLDLELACAGTLTSGIKGREETPERVKGAAE